jgi:chromosome segregation ATPase
MPLALLREIIRRPGESISVFIQKELTPRVTSIREGAESRLDKLFRREDQLEGTSAADLLKSSQKTLEEWQGKIDERIRQGIENLVGTFPALGRDIHSVRQKLEELEKKIEELERKPESKP